MPLYEINGWRMPFPRGCNRTSIAGLVAIRSCIMEYYSLEDVIGRSMPLYGTNWRIVIVVVITLACTYLGYSFSSSSLFLFAYWSLEVLRRPCVNVLVRIPLLLL